MGRVITVRLAAVTWVASLAACAVGPNFKPPAPPTDAGYGAASVQQQTASAPGADGGAQHFVADMDIPGEWWALFRSPKLSALVQQALRANPNGAAAAAALRQANELYLAQRASYLPVVQGGFSANRAENPVNTLSNPTNLPQSVAYYNLYTAQLSVSYLPDVFGGTRRSVEAAKAQVESSRFQLEATYLTLSSNVVAIAVQEASLRDQIVATERQLELQRQMTQTVRGQRSLGTASELDLLTQQSAEAQTAATLPPLQKQLGQTRDALTALLGQLPSGEPDTTFHLADLALPSDLPVSVPASSSRSGPMYARRSRTCTWPRLRWASRWQICCRSSR